MGGNIPKNANVCTPLRWSAQIVDWCEVAQVTIDMLPDVALLTVFDFYVDVDIEEWQTLVHVCRKWRNTVFGSPRRLNLQIICKASTPVRETLDVWPPLPIAIRGYWDATLGVNNILAALEHNDRICELQLLDVPSSQLEKVLAGMQQPYSALTCLHLQARDETAPVDPNLFLGGTAPRLRTLTLERISFPRLTKLLLSTTHLVYLDLWEIPRSGYISPEAMVTCLSLLTRLESLDIAFESPQSFTLRRSRRPPPPTRTLLPIIKLRFKGVSEYLEDLVARIDAPLLDKCHITFFHQLIFDTPQLAQFISRTPKFKTHDEARVFFSAWAVSITTSQTSNGALELAISCKQPDWQLSSLAQLCSSSLSQILIPMMEHLYIRSGLPRGRWQDDIESSQWLELLHPFTAVKGLYASREIAPRIAPAIQELVGERVTEVLPALRGLFLEEPFPSEPVQEIIGRFVAARQLADHPIAVSRWETK